MTTDTVGGVWTFTKELAGELIRRGWSVLLVSFGRAPSEEQLFTIDQLHLRGGLQYVASDAPLEWMPKNGDAYSVAEPLLLELCRTFAPDALLLSQYCFGALPTHLPKVVVAHSDVLGWADAVGKAPLAENAWLRNYVELVQAGLHGANAVVAPTRAMLDSLPGHYQLRMKTTVISNGRSIRRSSFSAKRQLRAVSAGRMWDPAKGLRTLMEVSSSIPITVAGENETAADATKTLTLTGLKTEDDLFQLFEESAIYICCSVYEPFGLAPVEAALCGCAILANDIPSLREVWGEAAWYFTDALTLAALLQELSANPVRLAALQELSFERARYFTAARMVDSYVEVISACVADVRSQARAA